ncbi:MAG: efflux RND transporter periplasmic adaptor subunit [Bryobacterales bacterium]|nr:efflux RND transporter periplasmic adaptor subunit [Bryobacterales bacterium]
MRIHHVIPLWTVLLIVGLTACNRERQPGASVRASSDSPMHVPVLRAARRTLTRSAELAAEFRAYQEVDVHAKVAGYLKNITVDLGDHVRAGQEVASLEVPEFGEELLEATARQKRSELDVVRAQSEVARAQAAYDIAKLSLNRIQAAAKARPELIAQQELDTSEARYRESEAQLATVKANLAALRQQVQVSSAGSSRVKTMLSYLRIVAPFNGIVTRRFADPGAMIQAGTASQTQAMPVVRIAQVDRLRLVLPVPESIVSRIRTGNPVEVRVDSLQRVFQGRVSRFSGQLKTSTRTMETEVDIDNGSGLIRPGMYGYATLVLESRAKTLAVPIQSVNRGLNTTVLVVKPDGVLEERPVRIGMETPHFLEVLDGIQEGELVVLGSKPGMKPGLRVTPRLQSGDGQEGAE